MAGPIGRCANVPACCASGRSGRAFGLRHAKPSARCNALRCLAAMDRGPSWHWRLGRWSLDPGPVGRSSLDAGRFGTGWRGKPPRTIRALHNSAPLPVSSAKQRDKLAAAHSIALTPQAWRPPAVEPRRQPIARSQPSVAARRAGAATAAGACAVFSAEASPMPRRFFTSVAHGQWKAPFHGRFLHRLPRCTTGKSAGFAPLRMRPA